jgi:TonB-dependent receptor
MPYTTSIGDIESFEATFANRLTSREEGLEARTDAYELKERVFGAYLMAELNLTPRLMLLPGVRFERTELTSDGQEFDAEQEALTPRSAENDYGNVFPMVHARYCVGEATNVRAAFTSTIFRPNFFDLVPYVIRDGDDVERGNPALDPVTAGNFDLMVERYDRNVGLMSAGVFYKRLDKPIFISTVDNDAGGETSQPLNAESGAIRGFEVALQKRLTFLPGVLDGLGVYANFTWTGSEATQPNGRQTRLAGQAENAYNLALSYEKRGFSGQISMNRIGEYIDELGEDAEGDLSADGRTQIDLSASYFLTPSTQLFLEALNLGNEPYRTYQFQADRVRQLEFYEPWVQLGVRFRP